MKSLLEDIAYLLVEDVGAVSVTEEVKQGQVELILWVSGLDLPIFLDNQEATKQAILALLLSVATQKGLKLSFKVLAKGAAQGAFLLEPTSEVGKAVGPQV